jgi:hypothetical protein
MASTNWIMFLFSGSVSCCCGFFTLYVAHKYQNSPLIETTLVSNYGMLQLVTGGLDVLRPFLTDEIGSWEYGYGCTVYFQT